MKLQTFFLCLVLIIIGNANANSFPPALIEANTLFDLASQGDAASVEPALNAYENLRVDQTLQVFVRCRMGSLVSMQARDTWTPWNKMRYAEQGLDLIDQALELLTNADQQKIFDDITITQHTQLTAAITFTSLPKFFKRWSQAEYLFKSIVSNKQFEKSPLAFQQLVWTQRANLALQRGQNEQSKQWQYNAERIARK